MKGFMNFFLVTAAFLVLNLNLNAMKLNHFSLNGNLEQVKNCTDPATFWGSLKTKSTNYFRDYNNSGCLNHPLSKGLSYAQIIRFLRNRIVNSKKNELNQQERNIFCSLFLSAPPIELPNGNEVLDFDKIGKAFLLGIEKAIREKGKVQVLFLPGIVLNGSVNDLIELSNTYSYKILEGLCCANPIFQWIENKREIQWKDPQMERFWDKIKKSILSNTKCPNRLLGFVEIIVFMRECLEHILDISSERSDFNNISLNLPFAKPDIKEYFNKDWLNNKSKLLNNEIEKLTEKLLKTCKPDSSWIRIIKQHFVTFLQDKKDLNDIQAGASRILESIFAYDPTFNWLQK